MLGNLKDKLSKTRKTFIEKFEDIINSEKNREKILEEITETLILADAGIQTSEKIIQNIKSKIRKTDSFFSIRQILKEEIIQMLSKFPSDLNLLNSQSVIMFVGVNGGGKTTSLAKLANKLKQEGNNVLMVAADTFRAAAQEQLVIWGKKLNIPVITGQYNA
ncbi:MAG: signal recognition particle receptor subunit alpha, partial [Candidatus Aminicenantaceae bacterium]